MKTKLIISTKSWNTECWTNLPFSPRIGEWFNLQDIFTTDEISEIKASANCWSGVRGMVQSVEYRHDDNEFYAEVVLECEDNIF